MTETTPQHCEEKELPPESERLVLAITGLPGSGKTTLIGYLKKELTKLGYPVDYISVFRFSDYLRESLNETGITNPTRKDYGDRSQELRPTDNPGIVTELYQNTPIVIVDGLRNADEAEKVFETRGVIVALFCPTPARYARAKARQSGKDNLDTLDEFLEGEKEELFSDEPNGSHTEFAMSLAPPGQRYNTSYLGMHDIAQRIIKWLQDNNKLPELPTETLACDIMQPCQD